MEREVSVRKLNQQTSAVLKEVVEGHTVTVLSGGKPVARIVPIPALPEGWARLEAEGIISRATIGGPITLPPRTPHSDIEIAQEIERDREAERW